jgi:CBS domain-containing protein
MKVSEVMNKAMVVEDTINLKDAAKIMSDKNIGSLILMRKNIIVGIVTESDVMRNIGSLNKKVSGIMTKSVVTIEQNEDLDSAARIMSEHKIKRLPVTKKGDLVGIVTATDVIANSEALNESFLFD